MNLRDEAVGKRIDPTIRACTSQCVEHVRESTLTHLRNQVDQMSRIDRSCRLPSTLEGLSLSSLNPESNLHGRSDLRRIWFRLNRFRRL